MVLVIVNVNLNLGLEMSSCLQMGSWPRHEISCDGIITNNKECYRANNSEGREKFS